MTGQLILSDQTKFEGKSFGAEKSTVGEVVFSTGMVGYPESFTDPSYKGQILILTYPIIGNYGIPTKEYWESEKIQISGLIVSNYIDTPSHYQSERTLSKWLKDEHIPALEIKDTRFLTQKLREKGVMLGKIVVDSERSRGIELSFHDPNKENLVAQVSTKKIYIKNPEVRSYLTPGVDYVQTPGKRVILIDCGVKRNIIRSFLNRGVEVVVVPWDFNPFSTHLPGVRINHLEGVNLNFDAIVISNGPGDPKMADKTIETIQQALKRNVPTLGICLGHQLLALAEGGDTKKLKFGHRSQNQPCLLSDSNRCFITTQNHGFAVNKIPKDFKPWFTNANDGTNEGMIHEKLPIMSVQFHPEATPGPMDTEWIFDFFLEKL